MCGKSTCDLIVIYFMCTYNARKGKLFSSPLLCGFEYATKFIKLHISSHKNFISSLTLCRVHSTRLFKSRGEEKYVDTEETLSTLKIKFLSSNRISKDEKNPFNQLRDNG